MALCVSMMRSFRDGNHGSGGGGAGGIGGRYGGGDTTTRVSGWAHCAARNSTCGGGATTPNSHPSKGAKAFWGVGWFPGERKNPPLCAGFHRPASLRVPHHPSPAALHP